jgi:hypothetical protein
MPRHNAIADKGFRPDSGKYLSFPVLVLLGLAGVATFFLPAWPTEPEPRVDRPVQDGRVRGIVISTHRSGQDWGTEAIDRALDAVLGVGANWSSTHPYARIDADGSVRFRSFPVDEPPEYLVRPLRAARERGLKYCVKPHLAYWGSPFSWRGEIAFDTEETWTRFFDDYRTWIVALARACKDADAFVVGTELDATLHHEKEWRTIIAAVRAVTKAPLTYAANWTDYERVPFWDALDVIGIQAYFPLSDRTIGEEELRAAWRPLMSKLRSFGESKGRPIVFTELGYTCSFDAPVRPWEGREDGDEALPVQEACLRVALEAVENEPMVIGVFLWKWFPPPSEQGRNYRLASPEMKALISKAWGAEKR